MDEKVEKFDSPSIILVGREGMLAKLFKVYSTLLISYNLLGVGKSTLGNMLLKACNYENFFDPYHGAYDGDGEQEFVLVDTPGFTNEKTSSNRTWLEINKAIDNSYEHGVHAFLFRFPADRKSHLDECMKKLNNENVIIVFTKCDKEQTENSEIMKSSFADFVEKYINKIDNRWVVAPNHDIFKESSDVTTKNMNDLAKKISEIKNPWKRSKQLDSWHMKISEIKNPWHICLVVGLIFLILTISFKKKTDKFDLLVVEPAIVLLGETGSGKSTFGNYLGNGSCKFTAKKSKAPVTKNCEKCPIIIGDHTYNLIDTPGLNDPNSIKKINESIHIKFEIKEITAIIFVIKAIKLFDNQAINNKMMVLTNLDGEQIKEFTGGDKKSIERLWDITVNTTKLLKYVNYNWAIFPNPQFNEEIIVESMKNVMVDSTSDKNVEKSDSTSDKNVEKSDSSSDKNVEIFYLPSIILVGREGKLAKLFKLYSTLLISYILLGSGKSTVGNMLLKACNYETFFTPYHGAYDGDGEQEFVLVDTPGFTNEKTSSNRTWLEINKAIDNSYEHGVRAFLFVLEATADKSFHLDECMKDLNNENVIVVFTKCSKEQTESSEKMESSFPDIVKEFVKEIDNRWVVAPNHDIFKESSDDVITNNMNVLAKMISEIKNPWKRSKQLNSWHMMISEIKNPWHICLVVGLIFLILTTFPFNNNTKKFESPEVEPAIVLLGETGSGKSALGNYLGNGSCKFIVKKSRSPVTKNCEKCSIIIGGHTYNLIDTPGLNDPNSIKKINEPIRSKFEIKEIKVIIFVINPFQFESFNKTLEVIKLFDVQVINNKMAVLTKLDRELIEEFTRGDKKSIKHRQEITTNTIDLLKHINYNWAIFPNPEYKKEIIGENMKEIEKMIGTFIKIK
ncbi:25932_t:CDS:10, partial [Dentiscutata erythropus]